MLESARSIHRPSTGLLRRPTPSQIMEGGRLGRLCGPGALSHPISENQPAASPRFHSSWYGLLAPAAYLGRRSRSKSDYPTVAWRSFPHGPLDGSLWSGSHSPTPGRLPGSGRQPRGHSEDAHGNRLTIGALTLVATDGAMCMEEHLHMSDRPPLAGGSASGSRRPPSSCHRVVASDGSLTGYAGGRARMRALLDLERPCGPRPGRLF